MSDTKMNIRQKRILESVDRSGGISRLEVKNKLDNGFSASIPTIARDLSLLLRSGYIRRDGHGRNTKYFPISTNPLLKYYELDEYFSLEADQRIGAKKRFDFSVFSHFSDLFTVKERGEIDNVDRNFSKMVISLDRDVYLKELERFTIELSWKSSRIEGNTYSLLDAETLVKQKIESPGHPKEEAIMILNHKQAFESILKNKRDYKNINFSQVVQLHNFLVDGLGVNTGIRTQAVGITGTTYRPLDNQWQIKESLDKLLSQINKTKYPLEKALIILSMLSYIQPFADGNKRTSRMLANAALIAHDFYPLSYRSVDETFYKKALILFYEKNSLYHLKKIITEQYKFALETYFR